MAYGLWQTSICDTCQTTNFHNEKDCTYTIISVPVQELSTSMSSIPEYYFLIELKKGHTIGVKMDENVTFLFSGKYLMHRQSRNDNYKDAESVFFNFASYGNERLHNHIKSTMKRVSEE